MKKTILINCNAKLNLSLDVTGKRPDGYHTLESIFQSVSVYDSIKISAQEGDSLTFSCNLDNIPTDEKNLAVKGALAFLQYSGKKAEISIDLQKRIPSGAGMGGGSADAAGVIHALNLLLETNYPNETLRQIGLQVGADVPFILMGGTAYVKGIGEVIQPLKALPEIPVVIVKGTESISTPMAYRAIDALESPQHPDTKAILKAIETQDIQSLCENCGNLFEQAISSDDVTRAKKRLKECGASCAVMTGSGSAVFGLFPDASQQTVQEIAEKLSKEFAFSQFAKLKSESFSVADKSEQHLQKGGDQ